ncbi:glycosyltransferase family 2 protein [Shimia sp. SDUM112013]|uniref:glycosyltransferase family 2 protein n=1 Tax=Shimia sp. SDUM112013 TaxID=3136160 RepID=UPI0032EEB10A
MSSRARNEENGSATVAVLLATYNGAENIEEQLSSIASQTCPPNLILVSDDGSTDRTKDLVAQFFASNPQINGKLVEGPCMGAARNFMSLLNMVPDWIDAAMFSDQDDVWLETKIESGTKALSDSGDPNIPTLYCGRTWVCDEKLESRKISQLRKNPCFRHALVQNIAGGNTMMINRAAITLLKAAAAETQKVVMHDWWVYQLISGVGGQIIYDPNPHLLYRQHSSNIIGANNGLSARLKRLRNMLNGRFRYWNTLNIKALKNSAHRLTAENQKILVAFEKYRDANLILRLAMLQRTGLRRQGLEGRMALILAALLRRL